MGVGFGGLQKIPSLCGAKHVFFVDVRDSAAGHVETLM